MVRENDEVFSSRRGVEQCMGNSGQVPFYGGSATGWKGLGILVRVEPKGVGGHEERQG